MFAFIGYQSRDLLIWSCLPSTAVYTLTFPITILQDSRQSFIMPRGEKRNNHQTTKPTYKHILHLTPHKTVLSSIVPASKRRVKDKESCKEWILTEQFFSIQKGHSSTSFWGFQILLALLAFDSWGTSSQKIPKLCTWLSMNNIWIHFYFSFL